MVHIVDRVASNKRSMLKEPDTQSRMSRLKSILSFGRKHLVAALSVALGALAMAGLGQNAHRLWLVHLGFGVTYLILLVPLVWGISRLLKWKPEHIDDEKAPIVAVIILCCLFIVIVIPFHVDKMASLRPVAVNALNAFSVVVEYRMISTPGNGTGYWALSTGPKGCTVTHSNLVLFLRITNLQNHRAMISGYKVFSGDEEMIRLHAEREQILWMFPKNWRDSLGRSQLPGGRTIHFDYGTRGGQASLLTYSIREAHASQALPIHEANFLDRLLVNTALDPNIPVRGWAFFQVPSDGAILDTALMLTDETGHSYTYPIKDIESDPNADILPRDMTTSPSIDVTSCTLK
jgi:hypothetical protein